MVIPVNGTGGCIFDASISLLLGAIGMENGTI